MEIEYRGRTILIDEEDLHFIQNHKYRYNEDGYLIRSQPRLGRRNRGTYRLHREIMGVYDSRIVDHINGNRNDNRKCNLRVVDTYQSSWNTSAQKNSTSKYKGVSWDKDRKKWLARIYHLGKTYHIGRYNTENDAAIAYNNKARELFGEYARLNCV